MHYQVGRGSRWLAQAVARCTGVFPSILRLNLGNDKGTVDENTDSALEVTVKMNAS